MNTKLIPIVLTLVVGIILAGSVLMPVLSDAQKSVGEKVTYTNESPEYLSLSDGDVTILLSSGVLTINGETHTIASTDTIIYLSDYYTLYYNGTNFYSTYLNQTSGVRNVTAASVTVSDSKLTASVTYDNNTTQTASDIPLRFSFYVDPDGEYARFNTSAMQPYVKSIDDVFAGGSYYTGDNKTYYWFYEGEAGGYSEDYTYAFNATLTPVDGTYDVYTISNCTMSVGDEDFAPYHMVVKKTIDGVAEKGAAYSLLGAIPVMILVGLIMAAIGMITVGRRE